MLAAREQPELLVRQPEELQVLLPEELRVPAPPERALLLRALVLQELMHSALRPAQRFQELPEPASRLGPPRERTLARS